MCKFCKPNTYSDQPHNTACIPCPEGTNNEDSDKDSESTCEEICECHEESIAIGSMSSQSLKLSRIVTITTISRTRSPVTLNNHNKNIIIIRVCGPGTYFDAAGRFCQACDENTYRQEVDHQFEECLPCSEGTTSAPGASKCSKSRDHVA